MSDQASQTGFTVFPTSIGQCAVAWSHEGISATQLPERTPAATAARIRRQTNTQAVDSRALPGFVDEAIDRIQAVVGGATDDDLATLRIDCEGLSAFTTDVLQVVRSIQPGATMTYGDIARRVGRPDGARAVGAAMGSNRLPIIVPCHRVVAASGRIGGFSAAAGPELKIRMLHTEKKAAHHSDPPFDTHEAANYLAGQDPALAEIIKRVGPPGLRPRTATTLYADLIEAVLHQQLSTHVGAILFARLCAEMSQPLDGPTPSGVLQLDDNTLSNIGLSGAKIRAMRSLTERTFSGRLPSDDDLETMTDEEIIESVTAVWGIGQWTARTLLILRLCRPDVFCADDLAIRNVMDRTHRDRLSGQAITYMDIAEQWRPHRSLACWYLWQCASFPDDE